jgi:integrase
MVAGSVKRGRRLKGEGSLYWDKKAKCWVGRYWIDLDDGTKKRQTVMGEDPDGKDREEVLKKMRYEKAMADRGAPVLRDQRTTGAYLEYWLQHIDPYLVRPTTLQLHTFITRKYLIPLLGDNPLTQLRPEHVRLMLNRMEKMGCGARTLQHARNILSAALREALELEYVTRNVARLVKPPKYTAAKRTTWSKEQVARFLDVAKHHDRFPMFLLLLCYGLRCGELLGLRWQDIDFEKNAIRIRQSVRLENNKACVGPLKTETSERDLPMHFMIKDVLLCYSKTARRYDDDLIFHSSTGKPAWPKAIRASFQRLAVKAGLPPITIHEARHTVATMLAEAWSSPKEAQAILGHSSITTTLQIYTHTNHQKKEQALAALANGFL